MTTATIHTRRGRFDITLFAADAPKTVANFVELAQKGFYDGLVWHRILDDFMAQTGCPEGTGRGGPGYKIPDEDNDRKHLTGTLSMANSGMPNTGGSQFFVCHRPCPHLDGKHTIFGRVTTNIDIIYKLKAGDSLDQIVIHTDG